jgi:hypothetical protein
VSSASGPSLTLCGRSNSGTTSTREDRRHSWERMSAISVHKSRIASGRLATSSSAQACMISPGSLAQSPDICGERRKLVGSELRPDHGWHRAAIFLGVHHSFSDRLRDSAITPIAPQPLFGGKVWTQGRARAALAVATRTGGPAYLTVVNAIAKGNHCSRRSFGNRKVLGFTRAGLWIRSLRWVGQRFHHLTGWSRWTRTRSDPRGAIVGTALIHNPIDSAAYIVRHEERPVRPHGHAGSPDLLRAYEWLQACCLHSWFSHYAGRSAKLAPDGANLARINLMGIRLGGGLLLDLAVRLFRRGMSHRSV